MSQLVNVKGPKGCESFSHDGTEYSFNKKGIAKVPVEAVAELASHGIVPVGDDAADSVGSEGDNK